jgi:two-component system CheB/CheR fusion protein
MSSPVHNADFEALLDYLKRNRGFDFTGYKRSTLGRRIEKRIQDVGLQSYADYTDYLEVHPDEFAQLFNTILINVTDFLRDADPWDYLKDDIIPRILAAKRPEDPIRVWSAGCASGQETYTLAILLNEVLGEEQFRERVKIYATDVDEEALAQARQGSYTDREVGALSPEWLDKYFDQQPPRSIFRKEFRRAVIFGRHDLTQDAPISRVDLLVCRNTLMYFNYDAQSRILARLHFALNDHGYLFLGKAEMLLTHANLFMPVDLKHRVFVKVPRPNLRERLMLMAQAEDGTAQEPPPPTEDRLQEVVFETNSVAQVVVNLQGLLVLANDRARQLFHLDARDLGRPLQDLQLSYRPVELRSIIDQSYTERRPVILKEVAWPQLGAEGHWYDVQVAPLLNSDGTLIGASILFTDVTLYKRLQEQLEQTNHELETAYEELQSANEELETTNEELQSTVEELETTNEELQATNEELETMNEELQSSNEELETINDELRRRSNELNDVNAFFESILTSLQAGVVVVNQEMQIQVWNHRAEELWGLRSEEVIGHHFMNLDIGLPVERLRQPIRACLAGESPNPQLSLAATNRRGRPIQCHLSFAPLLGTEKRIHGAIVVMEEREGSQDDKQ